MSTAVKYIVGPHVTMMTYKKDNRYNTYRYAQTH